MEAKAIEEYLLERSDFLLLIFVPVPEVPIKKKKKCRCFSNRRNRRPRKAFARSRAFSIPPTPIISIVKTRGRGLLRHTTQKVWQKPRPHLNRRRSERSLGGQGHPTMGFSQSYLKTVTEAETKSKS